MQDSVTCRTASGGSGGFRRLSHPDQEITKLVKIRDGSYNSGSHYSFNVKAPLKQGRGIWVLMRKGQCRKIAKDGDIESSDAKGLWHAVRIYCLRKLGLIVHR
jgi:hypothetical protein